MAKYCIPYIRFRMRPFSIVNYAKIRANADNEYARAFHAFNITCTNAPKGC